MTRKTSKIKEIHVASFDLDLPDEYKPEWYKLGIEPYKANFNVNKGDGMVITPTTVNMRRGMSPLAEGAPNIKEPEQMESPVETIWFDAEDQPSDINQMVDNNETVNMSDMQKINVPEETFESVSDIRNKLLNKSKPKRKAQIGEFIVFHNDSIVFIGDETGTTEVCEKIIIENENLKDDDLVVFYRVALEKFFR